MRLTCSSARVDVLAPLLHQGGLVLADRPAGGVDLPIDVGDAHLVEVDQGDVSDPGAHHRLGRVPADTSEADHTDPCLGQSVVAGTTEEQLGAMEGMHGTGHRHNL